ncbi:hypothetical protein NPX13_g8916 [Xylaria arbuscula]|uniref:FAD-binding PCMH-type domain-containing protein n=1 Tax=Xylaria arbuscula TaxID=114810 RepID=A0A9W8N7N3_9PEZI|nr:hypothetical protein NPX13_g8916 [Xylaria arbuscula]
MSRSIGQMKVWEAGDDAYNASLDSYFSKQQQALKPRWIVSPETAEQVSFIVWLMSRSLDWGVGSKYAIRSGGYASWAGASNIDGGIVIDMRALNSVDVHRDTSTVSVGAGATWDEVYAKLGPLGLSVNGGTAAGVGVAGLTLGGGISFFSPRYGWTCDAVTRFQIVLADTSIVEVDSESDPGLFQALKGGSNNFGVVTRINFRTFEQGPIWLLLIGYPLFAHVVALLVKIASADACDEYASMSVNFSYRHASGEFPSRVVALSCVLVYTKVAESLPECYRGVLQALNPLSSTAWIQADMKTLADIPRRNAVNHARTIHRVCTLVLTKPAFLIARNAWFDSVEIIAHVPNIIWLLNLEPLPPQIYARHAEENALGLTDRNNKSLLLVHLTVSWSEPSDDTFVNETAHSLMDAIEREARRLGVLDPYIHMNHADRDQSPITSYGADSLRRLREVRDRVDPRGLFKKMVPGGFKIDE